MLPAFLMPFGLPAPRRPSGQVAGSPPDALPPEAGPPRVATIPVFLRQVPRRGQRTALTPQGKGSGPVEAPEPERMEPWNTHVNRNLPRFIPDLEKKRAGKSFAQDLEAGGVLTGDPDRFEIAAFSPPDRLRVLSRGIARRLALRLLELGGRQADREAARPSRSERRAKRLPPCHSPSTESERSERSPSVSELTSKPVG